MTAELYLYDCFRPEKFPGITTAQPLIGDFDLPTIFDLLVEDAEFVADAVSDRRNFKA